jgi:hypothetical protein
MNEQTVVPEFAPHPTGKFTKRFIDMTGHVSGRLTVIGFAGMYGNRTFWFCSCTCGTIKKVNAGSLKTNDTRSCGCLRRESSSKSKFIHGHTSNKIDGVSPEFSAFAHCKQRCDDANCKYYNRYGGRGIKFLFASFLEFYEHVGTRPSSKHSIDRIDNNGHYEPGNVRWATWHQQANNRSSTVFVTVDGKELPLTVAMGGSSSRNYKRVRWLIRYGTRTYQEAVDLVLNGAKS